MRQLKKHFGSFYQAMKRHMSQLSSDTLRFEMNRVFVIWSEEAHAENL